MKSDLDGSFYKKGGTFNNFFSREREQQSFYL